MTLVELLGVAREHHIDVTVVSHNKCGHVSVKMEYEEKPEEDDVDTNYLAAVHHIIDATEDQIVDVIEAFIDHIGRVTAPKEEQCEGSSSTSTSE